MSSVLAVILAALAFAWAIYTYLAARRARHASLMPSYQRGLEEAHYLETIQEFTGEQLIHDKADHPLYVPLRGVYWPYGEAKGDKEPCRLA